MLLISVAPWRARVAISLAPLYSHISTLTSRLSYLDSYISTLPCTRMVHLILTGATGLVGSAVLSHILSLPATSTPIITRLSILSRNSTIPLLAHPPPPGTPTANTHTQIEVIQHADFGTYTPELLARLQGADACIWALGVSQNDVSKDEYVRITRDYTLEAAKAFAGLRGATDVDIDTTTKNTTTSTEPNKFKFIYVSGGGATFTPRPWTPLFGQVKGETELALLALAKRGSSPYASSLPLAVYSARPSAVDGHNQPWLWKPLLRDKRSAWQRMYLTALLGPIRAVGGSIHSPTDELGKVLVDMALREGNAGYTGDGVEGDEGRVLNNAALRRLAREKM